jgi:poly-beta-hydroxyalkanoate depolymerase
VVSHNQADSYTLKFYDEYVTITDIIEEYNFNSYEDVKPYEELIKQLTHMMMGHNHAIISRIIKS